MWKKRKNVLFAEALKQVQTKMELNAINVVMKIENDR